MTAWPNKQLWTYRLKSWASSFVSDFGLTLWVPILSEILVDSTASSCMRMCHGGNCAKLKELFASLAVSQWSQYKLIKLSHLHSPYPPLAGNFPRHISVRDQLQNSTAGHHIHMQPASYSITLQSHKTFLVQYCCLFTQAWLLQELEMLAESRYVRIQQCDAPMFCIS